MCVLLLGSFWSEGSTPSYQSLASSYHVLFLKGQDPLWGSLKGRKNDEKSGVADVQVLLPLGLAAADSALPLFEQKHLCRVTQIHNYGCPFRF